MAVAKTDCKKYETETEDRWNKLRSMTDDELVGVMVGSDCDLTKYDASKFLIAMTEESIAGATGDSAAQVAGEVRSLERLLTTTKKRRDLLKMSWDVATDRYIYHKCIVEGDGALIHKKAAVDKMYDYLDVIDSEIKSKWE